MITLIHLLEHLGLPAGAAIAIVIAGRRMLTGGTSRTGERRDRDRGRDRDRDRRSRGYR